MKVRMTRFVPSFVQVRDLEPGQIYDLNETQAAQFIANGMAEYIDREAASEHEAAALRGPRRRG